MLLLYYLLYLYKTYNKQNEEGFIICKNHPLEVPLKKGCVETLVLESLFNKVKV